MLQHEHDEKEYMPLKLSAEDESAIFCILERYETTNAMFDDSIRGNLKVIDMEE